MFRSEDLVRLTPGKIAKMHSVHSRGRVASSPSRRKDTVTAISKMRYCERSPGGGGTVIEEKQGDARKKDESFGNQENL